MSRKNINQKHTRIYFDYFDLPSDQTTFIVCELCGAKANDIHHINARGMGGTQYNYTIQELMALCSKHHLEYGDIKKFKSFLNLMHLNFLKIYNMKIQDYEHEFIPNYKFPIKN
jgi:hypothetical protein